MIKTYSVSPNFSIKKLLTDSRTKSVPRLIYLYRGKFFSFVFYMMRNWNNYFEIKIKRTSGWRISVVIRTDFQITAVLKDSRFIISSLTIVLIIMIVLVFIFKYLNVKRVMYVFIIPCSWTMVIYVYGIYVCRISILIRLFF